MKVKQVLYLMQSSRQSHRYTKHTPIYLIINILS